jgi:hypothetical protein
MKREDIISRVFAVVDQALRPASVAQIGGFRPPQSLLTSWFGGHFFGAQSEVWPTFGNAPMLPAGKEW